MARRYPSQVAAHAAAATIVAVNAARVTAASDAAVAAAAIGGDLTTTNPALAAKLATIESRLDELEP